MGTDFSFKERAQYIREAGQKSYDLAIIGGGITGAGIARDAASRGMKVVLVEQNDFAQGTSSRSSKLIHGGIRYLENMEFGLVFEALSERRLLFEMAPHLVHPLRFVLPLYKEGRIGMFKMGLGMWLYDALSLFEAPEMHRRLEPAEAIAQLPYLKEDQLLGAYSYYDAYMDDDRLVLETLRSAHRHGAQCMNFVKASEPLWGDSHIQGLTCIDQLSGEKIDIKARHIVSSVGPWTDAVGKMLFPDWRNRLRPSKGIHLTLSRDRLPLRDGVVMAADAEKRIIFGIPRHEMVIIGTTDTDFSGDPGDVRSLKKDVSYLLKIINEYFPGAQLEESDVIASYAGVRPLIDDGSQTESGTSREHLIYSDNRGVTFIAGGKYTTYRSMAEESLEEILSFFTLEEKVNFRQGFTKAPLNPLATTDFFQQMGAEVSSWAASLNWSPALIHQAAQRHGKEAKTLLSWGSDIKGVDEKTRYWMAEALHSIRNTMCLNLKDFYLRRSPLFLSEKDHGWSMAEPLAQLMGNELSWNEEERKRQLAALHAHLEFEMGWRFRS